jgi:hypothetical protein
MFKDFDLNQSSISVKLAIIDNVDQSNFEELRKKFSGNIIIPIGGTPIDFGATYESFDQRRSSLHEEYRSNYSKEESRYSLRIRFSSESGSAYRACLDTYERGLPGLHLSAKNVTDEDLTVVLKYVPGPHDPGSITVAVTGDGLNAPQQITLLSNQSRPFAVRRLPDKNLRLYAYSTGYDDDIFIPKPMKITRVTPSHNPIQVRAIDFIDAASVGIARTTDPGNPNIVHGVGITNGCCPWTTDRYNRGVWVISSPSQAIYRFDVFVAAATQRPVQVQVNKSVWKSGVLNVKTAGACWNLDQCGEWVTLGDVLLERGQNEIWIERGSSIPHIGALRFIPKSP